MGGVTEAVHDHLGADAGARRERASQVVEVMEVDLGMPTSVRAFSQASCQTCGASGAALLTGQDVAIVALLVGGVEVDA